MGLAHAGREFLAAVCPFLGGDRVAHVVLPRAVDLEEALCDTFLAEREHFHHPPTVVVARHDADLDAVQVQLLERELQHDARNVSLDTRRDAQHHVAQFSLGARPREQGERSVPDIRVGERRELTGGEDRLQMRIAAGRTERAHLIVERQEVWVGFKNMYKFGVERVINIFTEC